MSRARGIGPAGNGPILLWSFYFVGIKKGECRLFFVVFFLKRGFYFKIIVFIVQKISLRKCKRVPFIYFYQHQPGRIFRKKQKTNSLRPWNEFSIAVVVGQRAFEILRKIVRIDRVF